VAARLADDVTPIDTPALKKEVTAALAAIYPERAGDFTQALMELGATLCGPNRKPDCENCPCRGFCLGHKNTTAESLPVRLPKRGRRTEQMSVLILRCGGCYGLRKRPEKGLLAGLWEFPHIPGKREVTDLIVEVERMGCKPREILRQVEKKHIFTHIEWGMSGIYMDVKTENDAYVWLTAERIEKEAALPTAFRQFWEEIHYV
jgi:A/G-specific adenine glycosylase